MNFSTELLKVVLFCLIWLCCLSLNTNSNYQNDKNKLVAKSYKNIINEEMLRKSYNLYILNLKKKLNEQLIYIIT